MLLTTLALAAALQGTQDRDFRWSGRIAEGKTLEIMGVNGSVRADAAGGSTAEVTASPRRIEACTTAMMPTRTAGRRSMEMAPAQLGMKSEA